MKALWQNGKIGKGLNQNKNDTSQAIGILLAFLFRDNGSLRSNITPIQPVCSIARIRT
jgi:hypothetical protein